MSNNKRPNSDLLAASFLTGNLEDQFRDLTKKETKKIVGGSDKNFTSNPTDLSVVIVDGVTYYRPVNISSGFDLAIRLIQESNPDRVSYGGFISREELLLKGNPN